MESKSNSKISVIVLNWNNATDTIECVKSLLKQDHENFEIFVGDNGSDLKDYHFIELEFSDNPKIKIRRFSENMGFTKAHNILMKEALETSPDYIALLNNDAFANPEWLSSMITCSIETGADLVTSKMLSFYTPETMDNAGHFMLNTGEIIPLGHGESQCEYMLRFKNIGPCAGACLYSTSMLKQIGLFDPYFETGYEDAELGFRAISCGYSSVFEPKAIVRHKMGTSVNKVMNLEYLIKIQLNIFYTYFKILPLSFIIINIPWIIFKFVSIVIIDLLFFRYRFLKLILKSHFIFFSSEFSKAMKARKEFRSKNLKRIGLISTMSKMKFFLAFDISRFWKYIILRKKTQYEKA